MGIVQIVALLGIAIAGFVLMGLRRKWMAALAIWVILAGYTIIQLASPVPSYFDDQDRMGHDAWGFILVVLTAIAALSFAAAFAGSALRARKKSKEVSE
jgi:predicted acyltransferase